MSKHFAINPKLDLVLEPELATSSRRCTGMKLTWKKNKASGWLQGTEIALDQFVAHVKSMK